MSQVKEESEEKTQNAPWNEEELRKTKSEKEKGERKSYSWGISEEKTPRKMGHEDLLDKQEKLRQSESNCLERKSLK